MQSYKSVFSVDVAVVVAAESAKAKRRKARRWKLRTFPSTFSRTRADARLRITSRMRPSPRRSNDGSFKI